MFEKLIRLYPQLTTEDFSPSVGTILLKNDSDGNGPYIAVWNHPTLAKPTEDQLK